MIHAAVTASRAGELADQLDVRAGLSRPDRARHRLFDGTRRADAPGRIPEAPGAACSLRPPQDRATSANELLDTVICRTKRTESHTCHRNATPEIRTSAGPPTPTQPPARSSSAPRWRWPASSSRVPVGHRWPIRPLGHAPRRSATRMPRCSTSSQYRTAVVVPAPRWRRQRASSATSQPRAAGPHSTALAVARGRRPVRSSYRLRPPGKATRHRSICTPTSPGAAMAWTWKQRPSQHRFSRSR